MPTPCPCDRQLPYEHCCGRLHAGQNAEDALALMRSRYSAYCLGNIDYLIATTLPAQQASLDRQAVQSWSHSSQWLGLSIDEFQEIAGTPKHAYVAFTARWQDSSGSHSHQERSAFVEHQGRWFFIDPTVALKAERNRPCPCGSNLKFKKCCAAYYTGS